MTVAEHHAAGCAGKQAFDNFVDAMRIVKRRRARAKGRITLKPYRCQFCRKVHLGNGK